jgi:hypothetical protein
MLDTPPTCWYCGSVQPHSYAAGRYKTCAYCGADLVRRPGERTHWVATAPPNTPTRSRPRRVRGGYTPPAPYRSRPPWSFPPSVWIVPAPTAPPVPPPVRDLRSVTVLAAVTAALYLVAAGAEIWRFVLLVRGRTEVLYEPAVRFSDALVTAAGWAALLAAVATLLAALPATARTIDFAARRAGVQPVRTDAQRLRLLLIPGWNLYGAGVVLSEIDGLLRLPSQPEHAPERRRFGWRRADLPDVETRTGPAPSTGPAVELRPRRLVGWWWICWVVNGVLAAAVLTRALIPGDLQSQADLVELHIVLDLVAAAVAILTTVLVSRWRRLATPPVQDWPAGWRLVRDQRIGSSASPRPITEPVSSPSTAVS